MNNISTISKPRPRITYIDAMKGIAMLFVVIQHTKFIADGTSFYQVGVASRMPMFFLLSGMFLPYKRSASEMVRRTWRNLLRPWCLFMLVGFAVIILEEYVFGIEKEGTMIERSLFDVNTPLWFLRALVIATPIGWWLAVTCNSNLTRIVVFFLLTALSFLSVNLSEYVHSLDQRYFNIIYAFSLPEVMGLLVFMWGGHMLVQFIEVGKLKLSYRSAAIVFVLALAGLWMLDTYTIRWHYVETSGLYLNIWIMAWLGILIIWAGGCLLRNFKPITLVGRNTLIILGTHYLVIQFCRLKGMSVEATVVVALCSVVVFVYVSEKYKEWKSRRRELANDAA